MIKETEVMEDESKTEKLYVRWCVAKTATVRNDDGEAIEKLHFAMPVWVMDEGAARSYVSYVDGKHRKNGWVVNAALAEHPVRDYAGLFYENKTGKTIPVYNRFRGVKVGTLPKNSVVSVLAVCGAWCLTNKGWTMFRFLKKQIGDFFHENANSLFIAIMIQAAKDYQNAIKKIRTGKCYYPEDYAREFGVIDEVTRYFTGKSYEMYFGNDDGKEKLRWLNENLGVDDKWLKEKRRIYEELQMRTKKVKK